MVNVNTLKTNLSSLETYLACNKFQIVLAESETKKDKISIQFANLLIECIFINAPEIGDFDVPRHQALLQKKA